MGEPERVYPELYRHSTLGVHLKSSLDDFMAAGKISEYLHQETMKQFDRSFFEVLESQRRVKHFPSVKFKATCKTFNHREDQWVFDLEKASFTIGETHDSVKVDRCKLICLKHDGKS